MNLSFIKLDINIMNDSKIKKIRKMPGGSDLFILWIGLMCLAMKSGKPGLVEIGDGIAYTVDDLSNELDINVDTVKLGLITFKKLKMIEIFENQEIFISNFEKHQELTKIERSKEISRKSSQKYRDKIKQLSDGHVTVSDEIDKEIDIDKEIEIEEDEIYNLFQTTFGRNPKIPEIDKVKLLLKTYKIKTIKNTMKKIIEIGWKGTVKQLEDALINPNILEYKKPDYKNDNSKTLVLS